MVSKATSKFIRMSPQKARLTMDLIRGMNVNEALMTLKFTNKPKATREIEKVVKSAVANATHKDENIDADNLFVERCFINEGPRLKRIRPAPMGRTNSGVYINIQKVNRPEVDAQLGGESIALQLEQRIAFRREMRKSVDSALRFGAKGIKVRVSGRLNGAEIARSEWYLQGRLPLHTLRADVDYGFAQAYTTYGVIGVKCWIYKGEILPSKQPQGPAAARI